MKRKTDLQNKSVLVVGSGNSGLGAAELLYKEGAKPVIYDANDKLVREELEAKLPENVEADIIIGILPEEIIDHVSLVVISPGVPIDSELMVNIRKRRLPVWGEIELAYTFSKGRIAAITGTNGKTTTTTLIGEIMKAYFSSVYVVGNIGKPYTSIALETKEDTVTVAEISSFQLETTEYFAPEVSAILNITPDHLDRHHTMEAYVEMKEKIAVNQTNENVCILNYENKYTREFGTRCPAKVIHFSTARTLKNGYYLENDNIYLAEEGQTRKLLNIQEIHLVGMCNVENVMAAIGVGDNMKVPMDIIINTVKEFRGVEHRIEYVATKGGVDYYNDSKGTNPDAAIQGIKAMTKPTLLIGGGYDKQSEYDEWIEAFEGKVKALVLIGQTKEMIASCARKHGIQNIILADTFESAFAICAEQAKAGDAVLLSPACASWGMFPNYEARGQKFKEYVFSLKES